MDYSRAGWQDSGKRMSHVIKYILFHTTFMSLHPQYAIDRILVMHFQLIDDSDMNDYKARSEKNFAKKYFEENFF